MRSLWALAICVGLLFVVGCEERPPINHAQVVSNASHMQLRDGFTWGDAYQTLRPAEPDANGRFWWQVRYHPGADGLPRIILVDAATGWARLPPANYQIRLPPAPKVSSGKPLQMSEGSNILVILPEVDADEDRQRDIEQEVIRLNALAANTGLPSLFSLRPARDGRKSLIYGWHNNTGIKKDGNVIAWLTARTPYRDPVWENLASSP